MENLRCELPNLGVLARLQSGSIAVGRQPALQGQEFLLKLAPYLRASVWLGALSLHPKPGQPPE
jgi:hypothetical protein